MMEKIKCYLIISYIGDYNIRTTATLPDIPINKVHKFLNIYRDTITNDPKTLDSITYTTTPFGKINKIYLVAIEKIKVTIDVSYI